MYYKCNDKAEDYFSKEDVNKIIEMYESEILIEEIMNFYKCEEHHIRLVLKENQIDRKYNKLNQEIYDRIVDKYENGMSQYKISYDLLISDCCIRKTLNKCNVQKRSYSENNRRYHRNSHYFDKINTQNKAYILGLLFADGNNFPDHNAITIALQEEDKYVLDFIKDELEYEGPIRFIPLHNKNSKYKNQYTLVINDPYMSSCLEKLGVVKAKSLITTFPEYIRMNYIRHFIRGYFDGDGSISYSSTTYKPYVSICGTYEFCTTIANIVHSMFGNCSIRHPKQSGESNTYIISVCGYNSVNNFMEWIYDDAEFKMKRKYQKYLQIKDHFETNINSMTA